MGSRTAQRYRLYIDESGDHTFHLLNHPSHRYLALLGVWLSELDYVEFADRLERFKRAIFGARPDNPVILHRSAVINRKGPFGILRHPDVHQRFNQELLEILEQTPFKMICVMIDKQAHLVNHAIPLHPYHYCLAALLDRYVAWLNYKNARGDVMAETRGKQEDLQLQQAYLRVYESGTLALDSLHYQKVLTSRNLKLKPKSANIAGLQLADVLAYPVKQMILTQAGLLDDPGQIFGKAIWQIAQSKWYCHPQTKQAEEYGIVML